MEDDGEVVRRYLIGVWGDRRLELLEELVGPSVTVTASFVPASVAGGARSWSGLSASLPSETTVHTLDRLALRQMIGAWHATFGRLTATIEEMIASDGRVAVRLTWHGTRLERRGIAALEREVTWTGFEFYRLAGGRIVELWTSVALFLPR